MNLVYLGKIVNTHGIKGELRIISNFELKDKVFVPNFVIYINKTNKEVINTYRHHKNFEMVTLKGYDDINQVLKYKGSKVYINKDDLNLKDGDYLLDDLLGFKIKMANQDYGIVKDIIDNNKNILLQVSFEKNYYIPYNGNYIKRVDILNKYIEVVNIKDLIL